MGAYRDFENKDTLCNDQGQSKKEDSPPTPTKVVQMKILDRGRYSDMSRIQGTNKGCWGTQRAASERGREAVTTLRSEGIRRVNKGLPIRSYSLGGRQPKTGHHSREMEGKKKV